MAIRKYKPTTPGRRGASGPDFAEPPTPGGEGELGDRAAVADRLGVARDLGLDPRRLALECLARVLVAVAVPEREGAGRCSCERRSRQSFT